MAHFISLDHQKLPTIIPLVAHDIQPAQGDTPPWAHLATIETYKSNSTSCMSTSKHIRSTSALECQFVNVNSKMEGSFMRQEGA